MEVYLLRVSGQGYGPGLFDWGIIFLGGYWPCELLAGCISPRALMVEGFWPGLLAWGLLSRGLLPYNH